MSRKTTKICTGSFKFINRSGPQKHFCILLHPGKPTVSKTAEIREKIAKAMKVKPDAMYVFDFKSLLHFAKTKRRQTCRGPTWQEAHTQCTRKQRKERNSGMKKVRGTKKSKVGAAAKK